MADSVIPGGTSTGGSSGLGQEAKDIFEQTLNSLTPEDQALLNELAAAGGTIEVAKIPGTDATYIQAVNTQQGADGKDVLTTLSQLTSTPSDATNFHLPSGNLGFDVNLPAGVDLQIQGPAVDQTIYQANAFFGALIDQYVPAGSDYNTEFKNAVDSAMVHAGNDTSVRFITPTDNATGTGDLQISGSGSANETVVINMYGPLTKEADGNVSAPNPVTHAVSLSGITSAAVMGPGTVNVGSSASSYVTGDAANQNLTGNAGNDTLIGGGGSDVLTGGSGADIFGVSLNGDTMITDFNGGAGDKLFFEGGETLSNFLQANITTVNLGTFVVTDISANDHHIYLVGVDPSTLTLDMIKFTI
jgi:Ca2+-binding RTX toxin-like protein